MKDVFRKALYNYANVEQDNDYLKDKIIFYSQTEMHDMFADINGTSQIVEVGKDKNMISPIQDKFLIMSNFSYYYFKDMPYKEINAKGADRYIAGYDYVANNIEQFDLINGMEMLEAMKCEDNSFYTLGSFLYEPDTNSVYIAVNRDFDKIWKVSIQDETIESYKGFDEPIKIKINQKIKLSDLKKMAEYKTNGTKNLIIIAMVLLAALASSIFIAKKNKSSTTQ
ncbi:MAG: hypothetical protein ACOYIF_05615 [Acetivibrionales bacterium]|jgi:hypothetical protein